MVASGVCQNPFCAAQPGSHEARTGPLPLPPSYGQGDEVLPVPGKEGTVLPPNSTADGGGCVLFSNHAPTGDLVEGATSQQPDAGACCRRWVWVRHRRGP